MSWGKVALDLSDVARDGKLLEKSFETKWQNEGSPQGAALFSRVNTELRSAEYYFTPEAMEFSRDLIEKYGGQQDVAADTLPADLALCGGSAGYKYRYLLRAAQP